jgi:hypothetical protein
MRWERKEPEVDFFTQTRRAVALAKDEVAE